MVNEENINVVRHMVGGNIGLAKSFYMGYGDKTWTEKDLQQLRDDSVELLEKWAKKENDPGQDILDFIAQLKNSDWSNEKSFNTFETTVFKPYTAPVQDEAQEMKDSLADVFKRNMLN